MTSEDESEDSEEDAGWMVIYGDDDAKDFYMAAGGNETVDRASWKGGPGWMADHSEVTAGPEGYCMATDHKDTLDRTSRVDREDTCITMIYEDTPAKTIFACLPQTRINLKMKH